MNSINNKLDELKHEYTEVNNYLRHYSTLRFSILTVYLAALGGVTSVAFGFFELRYVNPDKMLLWGRAGGLIVTLLFFHYELRIQSLIEGNLLRAKELEKLLGYKVISNRPDWRGFKNRHATNVFFGMLILFWLAMLINKFYQ